jgi:tetratricopeptide (TPR) repeat protein
MRRSYLLFSTVLLAGCATQPHAPAPKASIAIVRSQKLAPAPPINAQPPSTDPDAAQEKLLLDASLALKAGLVQQAIDNALDPIIATFESNWGHSERLVYSARTPVEAVFYMGDAAAHHQDSIVVGAVWAEAYELKAYALLDLGRKDEARPLLHKALQLAPENAGFLEELGAHYEAEKNWPQALATFQHAQRAAQTFSPPVMKNDELARAWRGIAFVYAETGKLDEAEALYHRCLELNANDQRAAAELRYVRGLRAQRGTH